MARTNIQRIGLGTLLLTVGGWCVIFLGDRTGSAADVVEAPNPAAPFQVPPGFVVERVAGPPLVEHPIMAGFDDRGRLFVGEAAGVYQKAGELLKHLPRSIRLLEDTDGDGRFDKATVFADKMTFPMGALWHDGALYVCSPPSLWRLEDTNGDGIADKRQELVTKFGFTGNAADIHGPFAGPDGRLYWTDGRHGHEIKRPDGSVLQGKAARIFRCKPDGSEVERICGGGMDDPVELAFTSEGEPIATVDILIGSPSRIDALIYCIEGGAYPYYEPVLGEFKRTGDLLPPVTALGWVAPSGLMRYRGTALGAEYRDNLFSTQFNTRKVQRHILERDGAGFKARNEDFLVSTDPDAHLTDVLEDADGSLLVIDTGGWFSIGCPTSQIAKPDVKGAIYRVRKAGAPSVADPWGQAPKWDTMTPRELAGLLDDPRFVVRDRAVHLLGKKGAGAVAALREAASRGMTVRTRRNAVWALTRIEDGAARSALREALADKDLSVRLAAAHAVGLHRDAAALPALTGLLTAESPALRRQAATALGRLHEKKAVPALLDGLRAECDRFLEHALIYALIEIADREATLTGLGDTNLRLRRTALIALDQMDGGNLTREQVVPLLDTEDPKLWQTAWGVVTARPEWAGAVAGLVGQWLARGNLSSNRQEPLRTALLAFCKDQTVQELVAQALRTESTPPATRLLLLEVMSQAPLDKLPATWIAELGRGLEQRDDRIVRQTVATIRSRNLTDFDAGLQRLASDTRHDADVRSAALAAAAPRLQRLTPEVFAFALARLDPNLPPLSRLTAAEALGHAHLDGGQFEALLKVLPSASPLELPHLVAAFEHGKNAKVGRALVAALEKSPTLTSLAPDALRHTLQGYPAEVRQAAEPLLKRLAVDGDKQKAHLAELEPTLAGGDAKRGRAVFFGRKAACATCHAVQTDGGRVGPDLTKIGSIRTARDLLEAVVFPSASIVRGYEPYVVATRDGRVLTGIFGRETADAITLVNAERAEFRVPRTAIESIAPSRVSIMPQGMDAQLSKQELADLIAYLQSLR